MHLSDIHWIVIEDANQTYLAVERILQRSKLLYTYFYTTTMPGFPRVFYIFNLLFYKEF